MSGDDRFSSMHSASTFKKSKKDSFKVKVDDRFKTLLTDERFQSVHGQVDQYGRKVKNKGNQEKVANEMKQFYEIEQDNDAAQSAGSSKPKFSQSKKDNKASGVDRLEYLNKLARGEISDEESSSDSDDASASTSSDSSEEDEDSSDESGSSDDDRRDIKSKTKVQKSALAIPDQEEPELVADVSSSRIAIQNCDWENLSAEDIM